MIDPYRPLSLYIHFPFCTTKCSYCAFYSEETRPNSTRLALYETALLQELEAIVKVRKIPFETVYLGGGNPGLASFSALKQLLDLVSKPGKPKECNIELNPESLKSSHARLFENRITRMSLGIQSLHQKHLQTLGRHATREVNLHAIELAKNLRNRFNIQLNLDLMTCIPGQSISDALDDIDSIISLAAPEHLSLYNLTVEEGTVLAETVETGMLQVLDEDQQADMLNACWAHLAKKGYSHYEISNFSTSVATRSQHNERYWRLQDYIGLGPSAAGTFITETGGIRTSSESTIATYCTSAPFSTYTVETMDKETVMSEQLLMGLRTAEGIDKKAWLTRYKNDFDQLFKTKIAFLEQQEIKLIKNTENYFSLTSAGCMLLDAIVLELSLALK